MLPDSGEPGVETGCFLETWPSPSVRREAAPLCSHSARLPKSHRPLSWDLADPQKRNARLCPAFLRSERRARGGVAGGGPSWPRCHPPRLAAFLSCSWQSHSPWLRLRLWGQEGRDSRLQRWLQPLVPHSPFPTFVITPAAVLSPKVSSPCDIHW